MSSSSSQTNSSVALATYVLTYYGYSFMLIIGDIGNILNIVLFLQKKLRKTSCNNYFLASAFTNLIALNVGILLFIPTDIQPWNISMPYCKIENYIISASLQMSRYLILAACFDRYALCSRNASLRKFCRVRIARRYIIPSIILIWLLIPLYVPILITIENSTCTYIGTAAFFDSIYGLIMTGILPPSLMFIFSLLIYHNLKLRHQRRQIHPSVLNHSTQPIDENRRMKIKDQQVFAMLLVQAVAYLASSTPNTITTLYVVLETNNNTNETIENQSIIPFISFLTNMLRFLCPFTSFYLFILVSRLYRGEMMSIILSIYNRCSLLWRRNHDNQHNSDLTHHSNPVRQSEIRHEENPAPMPCN